MSSIYSKRTGTTYNANSLSDVATISLGSQAIGAGIKPQKSTTLATTTSPILQGGVNQESSSTAASAELAQKRRKKELEILSMGKETLG